MAQQKIETAAVLGSGVMGSGIAALLAGAGVKTYLMDIPPKEGKDRNAIANKNLKAALKAKPPAFYSKGDARLVTTGNFEDDLDKLAECDWVIEVIIENLEIKQKLMADVAKHVKDDAIISTNTSGIDVDAIAEGLPEGFRKRWLGTHFFNPPRWMKLLELIPGKDTDPAVMERITDFGRDVLGKGIIYAKNTPNFVANRVGAYGMIYTVHQMIEDGLTIPEVDAIMGKPMGRPKTAVYKTADMVGIDTLVHVAKNIHPEIPDDKYRDGYKVPEFIQTLVDAGNLGKKSGAGFYKKDGKQRLVLDWESGEYVELERPEFDSVKAAKGVESTPARIKKIVMEGDDKAAEFAWKATAQTLIYSAYLIPEISDNLVEIDRGMRWGYNWELGPFQTWDALGVQAAVDRMEKEGMEVPENVKKMLADGADSFYDERDDGTYYYDLVGGGYVKLDEDPKEIAIPELKAGDGTVFKNNGAHLVDMGDGILLVEFHTKMNAVDPDIIAALDKAMDLAEAGDWQGIVIGNHADNFSAGANLMLVYMNAQQGNWDDIETMIDEFHRVNMRLKYGDVPTVAAVSGMALGGGCEIPMHCDRVVLAGDTFAGLVEVGVGLIPAAGGTKESVCKLQAGLPHGVNVPPLELAQKAFQNIATAKVSMSAKEAVENGHFNPWQVRVELNRDHILHHAKNEALGLAAAGYRAPNRVPVKLAGGGAYGGLLVGLDDFQRGGFASEYDVYIGKQLAKILTGGNVPEGTQVDEGKLLELEKEVFLKLAGEEKTQARIQHMLTTNKPLRN